MIPPCHDVIWPSVYPVFPNDIYLYLHPFVTGVSPETSDYVVGARSFRQGGEMTTEPCPTCKGVCCVNKYGNPADHGSALALHSCPKCDNGSVEISPEDQERAMFQKHLFENKP